MYLRLCMCTLFTLQSSEVVGVIILERCLVQLDDDVDQSLCSFVIGYLILAFNCLIIDTYPHK